MLLGSTFAWPESTQNKWIKVIWYSRVVVLWGVWAAVPVPFLEKRVAPGPGAKPVGQLGVNTAAAVEGSVKLTPSSQPGTPFIADQSMRLCQSV